MKYEVTLNGKLYEVDVTETEAVIRSVTPVQQMPATSAPKPAAAVPANKPAETELPANGVPVKSPMPGTILAVKVSEGQQVSAGDVLFILEAMKMENEIAAPVSGTVKKITVNKGSNVETDAVLAVL